MFNVGGAINSVKAYLQTVLFSHKLDSVTFTAAVLMSSVQHTVGDVMLDLKQTKINARLWMHPLSMSMAELDIAAGYLKKVKLHAGAAVQNGVGTKVNVTPLPDFNQAEN